MNTENKYPKDSTVGVYVGIIEGIEAKPEPVRYVSYTATKECEHKNGWYDSVSFWVFEKRFFVCTDCERLIKDK